MVMADRILLFIPFVCVTTLGLGLSLDHFLRHKVFLSALMGFILVLLLGILAAKNYKLHRRARFVAITILISVLNFLLLNFFFLGDLEQDKTFLPFIDTVKAQMTKDGAGTDQLIFFRLSEMERGVFSFYWERNLPDLQNETDVKSEADKLIRKSLYFVTNRNNLKVLQPVIDSRFELLFAYRPDQKTRSYVFYRINPREDTHASKNN